MIHTSHICNMYVHKGEIIEKAVRSTRFPITLLAKRLGKSRRHVYYLFEKPDVSLDMILHIGKIIQYDFSDDLQEISKIPVEYQLNKVANPDIMFENLNYWKSKYFELLEQHKLLLQNKLKEYFKN